MHLFTYWPIAFMYCCLDMGAQKGGAFEKRWKVQGGAPRPTWADYWKCAKQVVFNQLFVSFPMIVAMHHAMQWRTNGTYTTLEAWPLSFWTFLADIAVILLWEELLFYYSHRLAHWGPLYRLIHKRHHEFRAPVAMAALYAHPMEHLVCNLVPVHFGCFIMGSHLSTCAIWYTLAVVNTLNSHSGWHLPLTPSPEAHDYHHLVFNENFGVLGILDYVHQTDVGFRRSKQFKRHVVFLWNAPLDINVVDDDVGAMEKESADENHKKICTL